LNNYRPQLFKLDLHVSQHYVRR